MHRQRIFGIWGLRLEKFESHVNVVVIKWREESEDGSALIDRVIQTSDQYDQVIKEFTDNLASVYRP
jgi:hypothetical protein